MNECENKYILGILTTVFASFLLHLFASLRDRRNKFNEVLYDFKEAFLDVRTAIDPITLDILTDNNDDNDVSKILKQYFADHKKAVFLLSHFLDKCNQQKLEIVWKQYHLYEQSNIPLLEQYSTVGVSREEKVKRRNLAIQRLDNIVGVFNFKNGFIYKFHESILIVYQFARKTYKELSRDT